MNPIDWTSVFVPRLSLLELILRGTLIYLSVFLLLRGVLQRQAGTVGITDLLVVVLLADAAQNGLASDYRSVPEAVVLVGTIIFWNYTLDWLAYRSKLFARLVHPPPLPLVKDGRLLRRNMRQEFITEDELRGQLRKQGIDSFEKVRLACMEEDGHISVLARDKSEHHAANERTAL